MVVRVLHPSHSFDVILLPRWHFSISWQHPILLALCRFYFNASIEVWHCSLETNATTMQWHTLHIYIEATALPHLNLCLHLYFKTLVIHISTQIFLWMSLTPVKKCLIKNFVMWPNVLGSCVSELSGSQNGRAVHCPNKSGSHVGFSHLVKGSSLTSI